MQDNNILDLKEPEETGKPKALTLPLQLAVAAVLIGAALKLQHWPGSLLMLAVGNAAVLVLYPIRYSQKQDKKLIDHVKLLLAITWSLNGIFITFDLPYKSYFKFVSAALCLAWIVIENIGYFNDSSHSNTTATFASPYFALAALLTIGGAMLYIRHWPFALLVTCSGIAVGMIWVFKDLFKK